MFGDITGYSGRNGQRKLGMAFLTLVVLLEIHVPCVPASMSDENQNAEAGIPLACIEADRL